MVRRRREHRFVTIKRLELKSSYLERVVIMDVYLPIQFNIDNLSLLLLNDGQDLERMPFVFIVNDLLAKKEIQDLCCIALHCGPERRLEYGTAYCADYLNRGTKAGLYTKFIFGKN